MKRNVLIVVIVVLLLVFGSISVVTYLSKSRGLKTQIIDIFRNLLGIKDDKYLFASIRVEEIKEDFIALGFKVEERYMPIDVKTWRIHNLDDFTKTVYQFGLETIYLDRNRNAFWIDPNENPVVTSDVIYYYVAEEG